MEAQQPTPGKFARNYGVILGVIMIFIAVIMYVTGMSLEGVQWPQYLYYIIFPVVIFYAISQFKKQKLLLRVYKKYLNLQLEKEKTIKI